MTNQMKILLVILVLNNNSGQNEAESDAQLQGQERVRVTCYMISTGLTWLPNTPMEVAVLIWLGGNHVAASCAGMPRMKIWLAATTVWPVKVSHHWVGPVLNTFSQEPRQVPAEPSNTPSLRPCQEFRLVNIGTVWSFC